MNPCSVFDLVLAHHVQRWGFVGHSRVIMVAYPLGGHSWLLPMLLPGSSQRARSQSVSYWLPRLCEDQCRTSGESPLDFHPRVSIGLSKAPKMTNSVAASSQSYTWRPKLYTQDISWMSVCERSLDIVGQTSLIICPQAPGRPVESCSPSSYYASVSSTVAKC